MANKRPVHYEKSYCWTTTPQGDVVKVSLVDADLIESRSIFRQGRSPYEYPAQKRSQKIINLHRLVAARIGFSEDVDHINKDHYDARRSNLRPCSHLQNMKNIPISSNNQAGYKGVWKRTKIKSERQKPWRAKIQANGKRINLGSFWTAEEAARCYDEAALKYHGKFAATNKSLGLL